MTSFCYFHYPEEVQKITPFLWFEKDASKVAEYYTSIFRDSKMLTSQEVHNTPSGDVEIVSVSLAGQEFTLMSAGPMFHFTEAISFVISCDNQEEIDYYWEKLTADGGEEGQCGWLKDKYGVSWQVVPNRLGELQKDPERAGRVTQAMLKMKKFIIADLENA